MDRLFYLSDGRQLGYSEFGDPNGQTIFACHGSLSSRNEIDFCDPSARELGFRVISIDRPGIGLSSYQKRRTLLSFPADVEQLADHLGVDDFGMYGWSAGGPYALACAAILSERVRASALLGSAGRYESLRGTRGLDGTDQMLIAMSRYARRAMAMLLQVAVIRASDQKLFETIREGLPTPDLEYLDRFAPSESTRLVREAMKQGTRGVIRDYRIMGAPWGFSLKNVTSPVDLWVGSEDFTGPADEQERLAADLPNASLHVVQGAGHLSLGPDHIHDILRTLRYRFDSVP